MSDKEHYIDPAVASLRPSVDRFDRALIEIHIALGFPLHTEDRARLRARFEGHALPAIVPDSTALPCMRCGMTLAVGPRTAARVSNGERLACPDCITVLIAEMGGEWRTENLGNPDSKLEEK